MTMPAPGYLRHVQLARSVPLFFALAAAILLLGCSGTTRQQAALHIQEGNYGLAEPLLRKALDQYSLDWNAYLQLGSVYRHTGRLEQARLVFQQIARKNPEAYVSEDTSVEFAGRRVAELANHYLVDMGEGPVAPDLALASPLDSPDSVESLERDILLQSQGGSPSGVEEVYVSETVSLELEPVQHGGPSGQGYGVHVLSFKRALGVEEGKERLLKRFPSLFAGKEFRSRRVDLGGSKGVYHRLISGPYATRSQAAQVCRQLKQAYGYCEVVDF